MKIKTLLKTFTALGISASMLVACTSANVSSEKPSNNETEKLKVVATTTQICDYTKQIGQEKVNLTCLLEPNASAHELELTNSQMEALNKADLLLTNGVDLEHFLDQAFKASDFKGETVVTSEGVETNKWDFPGENGEPAEFEYDPHIWTSPLNAKIQVENIISALQKLDSKNSNFYKEQGETYIKMIDDLDHWAEESINSIPEDERVLFTSHDAFGYFSERYKIKFLGAAIPDFSDLAETTAKHLQEVAQKIKDSKAKVIFAENSNSDKNVKTLAEETGIKVASEESAMYGDSLGPKGSSGETYIGSIIHNVKSFVENTGGKVASLPESIKIFDKKK